MRKKQGATIAFCVCLCSSIFLGYQYSACGVIALEVYKTGGHYRICLPAFWVSLSDVVLFWPTCECPGNHLGGHFGAIFVIWAVRASIWTPRGSKVPKKSQPVKKYIPMVNPFDTHFGNYWQLFSFGGLRDLKKGGPRA